jgi:AcrR family transcriptional regulator
MALSGRTSPAAPGRPRSVEAHRAILAAARALVIQGGYQAATIDAIVAHSGVAKTTFYRWWPNRAALIVDLLAELSAEEVPLARGTDPLRALRTEMRLIAGLGDAVIGKLITALLSEAHHDPEVRAALVQRLFNPRTRAMATVVARAQAGGSIRAELDPLTVVDLLVGPLFYRMFVRHEPLTAAFAQYTFDHVMAGLAPEARPPAQSKRKRPPAR